MSEVALVLGGSIAGLLAARVLSEAYDEVVIADRDKVLGVTTPRRGVPQGHHVHGLLARGQQVLDELFPGFTGDALAAGVPTGDLGELRWYFNGRLLQPAATGLMCLSAARPVLEALVRERVAALPNVRFLEEHDIVAPVFSADDTRVNGALLRPRTTGGAELVVTADLVIDATGRGSRSPVWLGEHGYQRPDEDRIRIDLSYTSRHYRLADESILDGQLSINPVSSPSHPRGAFFSRIENGRCALSLTGVLGDAAPTDPAGYEMWIKSLPVPDIHEVLQGAEALTDPVQFRYPNSVRRRYERLRRFPQRYLVIGDAACSFNPVYGQGMTVAALEALTLRDHLRRGTPDPTSFHRDTAAVVDTPWDVSAGGDLSYPQVPGRRTAKVKMMNAYLAKLQAAATRDARVTRTFMRVFGLVDPPQDLMRPAMVARVLRGARQAG